jgi:histidinol-phosphate phosphatase family protein
MIATCRPALFIDRDGTLIEDVPYNADPARVVLVPGAATAIGSLSAAGYVPIVISNQSGIGRGLFGSAALAPMERRINGLLAAEGASIAAFYYCPHAPADGCACRKPQPDMIERAAREHDVDLAGSWMIGDLLDDVEAGKRAGCRTILLDNGGETVWRRGPRRRPTVIVENWREAAGTILRDVAPRCGRERATT